MARPKSETEKIPINLRADADILAKIDAYAEKNHSNRTQVLMDAAQHYLETTKCVICDAIIPQNSKICPVCGNKLYSHDEIMDAARALRDRVVKEKNLHVGDLDDGMYGFYPISEYRCGDEHYFHAIYTVYTPDGDVGLGIGKDSEFRFSMDEIVNELNGNSYTVDISDKKKMDVKITVDKVKCPKCSHLNYPDSTWCTKCNTNFNTQNKK